MSARCTAHPRGTWAALRCRVIPCARRCEELIAAEVAWATEMREARAKSAIEMNARRRGLARAQRERDAARASYLEANLKAIDEELQLWEHQRLMIEAAASAPVKRADPRPLFGAPRPSRVREAARPHGDVKMPDVGPSAPFSGYQPRRRSGRPEIDDDFNPEDYRRKMREG